MNSDEQAMIMGFARRPLPVEAAICLQDDWCYHDDEEENCVGFLDVVGEWLPGNSFACTLDIDTIPTWTEEENTRSDHWMRFALRRTLDGSLMLPDGDDGGEWVKVGRTDGICVPVFHLHGVAKKTSITTRYNCIFYDNVQVNQGSHYAPTPGYSMWIRAGAAQRPNKQDATDPFNAVFDIL